VRPGEAGDEAVVYQLTRFWVKQPRPKHGSRRGWVKWLEAVGGELKRVAARQTD
jgi:hypothetical protein